MYEMRLVLWENIKDICEMLYKNNNYLTPYQEYDFLNTVGIGRKETSPFCTVGYRPNTFVLYKDSSARAVFPLYINKQKRTIVLRGFFSIIGHLDFIYANSIEFADFEYALSFLAKQYPGYSLIIDRLSEKSLTCAYLFEKGFIKEEQKYTCVSIPFSNGYEKWFSGLKKSFKQDIRSGYNRLRTDGRRYMFKLNLFETPKAAVSKDILRLYSKRACEHSNIKSQLVSKVVQAVLRIIKKNNPFTIALENSANYIDGSFYIDDRMVAYCQALLSNDGRVIVPKLSIDLEYKRYNLGGLLISEMIKALSEKMDNDVCCELDLSRGDERYKYDYGGMNHYNYNIVLPLSDEL